MGLRIAMVTTFYPPYNFGGDGISIMRLSGALARRGHDVTVLHDIDAYKSLGGAEPSDRAVQNATNDGVDVIGLRAAPHGSAFGLVSNILTHQLGRPVVHAQRISEILREGLFDVIWFHNISLIGGPGILSYGNGLKIYEAHEHWLVCPTHVLWRFNRERCDKRSCISCSFSYHRPPQSWRITGYLDRQLNHVDLFIAKSEFSRRKHAEFGFSQTMTVVPYFLPEDSSPEVLEPLARDRPFFLFVGRLEKIKGLQDIIPIFARYAGGADLVIIGDGDYAETLKTLATGLDNVHFLGRLPSEAISVFYRDALALIVPSLCYETFGIVLIEAFRKGTPVIARNVGPLPEIVRTARAGLLFDSAEELLSALWTLQFDECLRNAFSVEARAAFRKHWSEDVVIDRYTSVIRDAAIAHGHQKVADCFF
jgi:glycosyltransferase involved in cell wall biosynthesis